MKKFALFGGLLALVGASAAYAAGQFPNYPVATSSPTTGNVATLPLTGNEMIPADTGLPNGLNPQTEVITTALLRGYVLNGTTATSYVQSGILTVATLPTCNASRNGARATISNGVAYSLTLAAAGAIGTAVSTGTGTVTRTVLCGSTDQSSFAWVYGG